MKKQRYFIIGFIGITSLLLIGSNIFFDSKINFTKGLATVFSGYDELSLTQEIRELQRENADLRVQLSGLDHKAEGDYVVYSSYPFNNRSEIVIGDIDEFTVSLGDTVVYGNSILVGKVKLLTGNQAIVTTIFDPGFETAVRIGDSSTDALIRGGNSLELSLIPEDALIEVGDVVYTSNKDFPYGLEVGTIARIDNVQNTPLRTAQVEPSIGINNLRHVGILN
jgi:cell shape-determining protein MreC